MAATINPSASYPFDWQPNSGGDRPFWLVLGLCLCASVVFSVYVANQVLPPAPPQVQAQAAPRIVNFMQNRPKPALPVAPPKAKVVPPPVIKTRPAPSAPAAPTAPPTPSPQQQNAPAQASLGRTRQVTAADTGTATARAKAQSAGLLALGAQVASVLTSAPSSQVLAQDANTQASAPSEANNAVQDLGSARQVALNTAPGAKVQTQALDTEAVKNSAANLKQSLSNAAQASAPAGAGGQGRSDKDIAGVFIQHQPSLNKVYERARRQTPGLAGKLVVEFAIAADGSVSTLRVVASELSDADMQASIISRVKQFRFAAGKPQAGVRYTMEFLP